MATTSQPNQDTLELIRLFQQTKKMLPILSYNDMTNESVKPVLITLAGYELNHESLTFSINDARDVTASLISATVPFRRPKYHVNPKNQYYGYQNS